MVEKVNASIKDYGFQSYDGRERRPRRIPCGHTLCTQCISDNIQEDLLLCPFCRAQYQEFPVTSEKLMVSDDSSKILSKKLKSQIKVLISDKETISVQIQELHSHLERYKFLVKEWEEYHQQPYENFFVIENQTIAKSSQKESISVSYVMKEKEEKLLASTTTYDNFPTYEEVVRCYTVLETWSQEVQKNFTNNQFINTPPQLHERAKAACKEMDSAIAEDEESLSLGLAESLTPELDTATDSSTGNSERWLSTVQGKLKRALAYVHNPKQTSNILKSSQPKGNQTENQSPLFECMSEMVQTDMEPLRKIGSLWDMSYLVRQIIELGKVFAVQNLSGQQCCARISFKGNDLSLHALSEQNPPQDALLLKHEDVMSLWNQSSKVVFLEFGTESTSLGSVFITLFENSKIVQNFALMCSGERGVSYQDTNIIKVVREGCLWEWIRCGDYEYNTGQGGRELVEGAGHQASVKSQLTKGAVCTCERSAKRAAQFEIMMHDYQSSLSFCYIGQVTSSLHILQNAIRN